MRKDDNVESRKDKAIELFNQGYNCSQAVFGAFADLYHMELETALKLSASFGGGMGRMREVCGAVSGMFMVAGLETGTADGSDIEGKKHNYEVVQTLAEEYRRRNGSIICRELLGLEQKQQEDPTPAPRTKEYYQERPCVELVGDAVEVLERYLLREKYQGGEPPELFIQKVEQEKELQEVAELATNIWHEYFPSILSKEQIDYMVDRFQSKDAIQEQITTQGYIYYQIRLADTLIGYAAVKKEEDRLFISKLYMRKEYRGKGYASKVFHFLEMVCMVKRCSAMYLTVNRGNEASISIYQKKGFRIIKEQAVEIGNGFWMDDYVMEKQVVACN